MIYALKLLFVVLVVFGMFAVMARAAFSELLGADGFRRAMTVIGLCTVAAFAGRDMRVVMVLMAGVAIWGAGALGGGVRGRLAAMVMVAIVMPPAHIEIDGFAGINRFVDFSAVRLLSLLMLPGLAMRSLATTKPPRPGWVVAVDLMFVGYQVLRLALQVPSTSGTGLLRTVVEVTLDMLLPYYVFSRCIRSRADLRFILIHVALAGAFAATVACVESVAHRNLYEGLQWVYGSKWQITLALMRGDHLRTQAMTAQPILLAFELIFFLGIWTYLAGAAWRRPRFLIVFALLICGIVSTWSRGPWLGAIAFGLCLYAARKLSPRALGLGLVALVFLAVLVKATGADASAVAMLGGLFGSDASDMGTIDYRRQLLDTALALLKQSPWFGVPDYASQMQALKQGEGIIDLVNSYIAIALDAGVIGLVLYLSPYVIALSRLIRQGAPQAEAGRPDLPTGVPFAPVLASMCVALLATIFTTSTFALMPFLLTLLLALPVARLTMPPEPAEQETGRRSPIDLNRISFGVR